MLMWHPDEKPEDAGLQLLSCLFATVQISVCLDQITDDMKRMLLFWLGFMDEKREILLHSQIQPEEPENLYPEVCAECGNEKILVHYSKGRLADLRDINKKIYYIHAVKEEEVCFRCNSSDTLKYEVRDCYGNLMESNEVSANQFVIISVPTSGMVEFTRKL